MKPYKKIELEGNANIVMRAVPGHFVAPNAHVNYYIDLTPMESRISEAKAAAERLAEFHTYQTVVDTIVCLDGTEVIGAYLADELTKAGVMSKNLHKSIYVLKPELAGGQMFFRENLVQWVEGKNVLLLFELAATGRTILRAVQTLKFYKATITGISAIFSTVDKVDGIPIRSIFTHKDLPDYHAYRAEECPMCRDKMPVDGLWNGYGYTSL